MPVFGFFLSCEEAEGVSEIFPHEGRTWAVKIQCGRCRETTPDYIFIDPHEEVEVGGGTSNNIFACKFCKTQISSTVVPRSEGKLEVEQRTGKVIEIDFRGGEPVALELDGQWDAKGTGDAETNFTDVDLSDDFADYDEDTEQAVTINGAKVEIVRSK